MLLVYMEFWNLVSNKQPRQRTIYDHILMRAYSTTSYFINLCLVLYQDLQALEKNENHLAYSFVIFIILLCWAIYKN